MYIYVYFYIYVHIYVHVNVCNSVYVYTYILHDYIFYSSHSFNPYNIIQLYKRNEFKRFPILREYQKFPWFQILLYCKPIVLSFTGLSNTIKLIRRIFLC